MPALLCVIAATFAEHAHQRFADHVTTATADGVQLTTAPATAEPC